jgi:hypothetical protein
MSKVPSQWGYMSHRLLWVYTGFGIVSCLSLAVPYIVIYAMTGFQKSQSTLLQRLTVVGPLVLGQLAVIISVFVRVFMGRAAFNTYYWVTAFLMVPVFILSLVVVSQTILDYGSCTHV